jgi:hypothetical protein
MVDSAIPDHAGDPGHGFVRKEIVDPFSCGHVDLLLSSVDFSLCACCTPVTLRAFRAKFKLSARHPAVRRAPAGSRRITGTRQRH